MSLFAAFGAAVAIAGAPSSDYPTPQILAVFEEVCGDLSVGARLSFGLNAPSGWEPIIGDRESSENQRILDSMLAATKYSEFEPKRIYGFSRVVEGKRIYYGFTQSESDKGTFQRCHLFDFNHQLEFSRDDAAKWMLPATSWSMIAVTGFWVDAWVPKKNGWTMVEITYRPSNFKSERRSITLSATNAPLSQQDIARFEGK